MRSGRLLLGFGVVAGGFLLNGPARPGNSLSADSAVVAALDTKYQAAVKANDAEGMAAILTEDFILVTGKGAVFTRNDLLQAARARSTIYEHQEDTQQTVRLWGNTAVVTALLWLAGVHRAA